MFRKLSILLVSMVLMSTISFASETAQQVYTVEVNNDTPNAASTLIPTTTIRPVTDKIVGFTVMHNGYGANQETFAALYDSASTNTSDKEVIGENEATQNLSLTELYLRPRKITEGILVRQGARTIVLVQFIRE